MKSTNLPEIEMAHIPIIDEKQESIKTIGWIYCIKSSENDIYKCGKGTNLYDEVKFKKYLNMRYGIIIVNPEIIYIVNVSDANNAEKDLFKLLKDIKLKKELYKTNDVNYIKSKMDEIGEKYYINEELRKEIHEFNNPNGYSEVHQGDNKWELVADEKVYDKFTNSIAISILKKFRQYPDLNVSEELIHELTQLSLDRDMIEKKNINLFNTTTKHIKLLIINLPQI